MKIGINNHEITLTFLKLLIVTSSINVTTPIPASCDQDLICHLFFLLQGRQFEKGQKGEPAVVEPVSAGVWRYTHTYCALIYVD